MRAVTFEEANRVKPDWLKNMFWFISSLISIAFCNLVSNLIFGFGLINLVVEIVILTLFTSFFIIASGFCIYLFMISPDIFEYIIGAILKVSAKTRKIKFAINLEKNKTLNQSVVLVVCLIFLLYVLIPHSIMTVALRNIKQDYIQTAYGKSEIQFDNEGGSLDYGGKIDRIIDRRNKFLDRYHFSNLVPWTITTSSVNCFSVYIYTPWK